LFIKIKEQFVQPKRKLNFWAIDIRVAGGGKHRPRRAFLWNTCKGGKHRPRRVILWNTCRGGNKDIIDFESSALILYKI